MPGDGEPVPGEDVERLGGPDMDETDARMVGDGAGDGVPESGDVFDIAPHLRGEDEKKSLGDPPDEMTREGVRLNKALRQYFLQEDPAAASGSDPRDAVGAYSDFDMERDHMGTNDLSSTWYKSPGRPAGTAGDPYRGEDPNAQLGFHPPRAQDDPTTAPPSTVGMDGVAARRAPPIWQLSAGSDTSKVLGADAKPAQDGGESGDEPEEGDEEAEGTDAEDTGEEDDTAKGEKQVSSGAGRGRY